MLETVVLHTINNNFNYLYNACQTTCHKPPLPHCESLNVMIHHYGD